MRTDSAERQPVGTVISTMNIDHLPEVIAQSQRFGVDSYISEVAEEREEMLNVGTGITPTHEQYGEAIAAFRGGSRTIKGRHFDPEEPEEFET